MHFERVDDDHPPKLACLTTETEDESGPEPRDFQFKLYICGATEMSRRAVASARRICEERLPGQYRLEIVDLYEQPELANDRGVFALPTFTIELPEPLRRFIGDISENERLLKRMTSPRVAKP